MSFRRRLFVNLPSYGIMVRRPSHTVDMPNVCTSVASEPRVAISAARSCILASVIPPPQACLPAMTGTHAQEEGDRSQATGDNTTCTRVVQATLQKLAAKLPPCHPLESTQVPDRYDAPSRSQGQPAGRKIACIFGQWHGSLFRGFGEQAIEVPDGAGCLARMQRRRRGSPSRVLGALMPQASTRL